MKNNLTKNLRCLRWAGLTSCDASNLTSCDASNLPTEGSRNIGSITSRKPSRRVYPNEASLPADAAGLTVDSLNKPDLSSSGF